MSFRPYKPRPYFFRHNGKLRYSGNWSELAGDKETIIRVYDNVCISFGRQVARQVCNRLFIPGYPVAPLLAVGSGLRSDALADCVAQAGGDPRGLRFAPVRSFQLLAAE